MFKFPTLPPGDVGQTTQGIDFSISDERGCYFLDIEGGDSAERDDQGNSYMQRMVSVYVLVASYLLIYNICVRDIRTLGEVNTLANMCYTI